MLIALAVLVALVVLVARVALVALVWAVATRGGLCALVFVHWRLFR